MRNIYNNAEQGRLSENYLTQKIIALNILDTKYSRFTVLGNSTHTCILRGEEEEEGGEGERGGEERLK